MKPFCNICGESDLGCAQFGCWRSPARSGAVGMVLDSIAKEREPKERKLNKVNMILGVALFVGVVALVLGVAHVL